MSNKLQEIPEWVSQVDINDWEILVASWKFEVRDNNWKITNSMWKISIFNNYWNWEVKNISWRVGVNYNYWVIHSIAWNIGFDYNVGQISSEFWEIFWNYNDKAWTISNESWKIFLNSNYWRITSSSWIVSMDNNNWEIVIDEWIMTTIKNGENANRFELRIIKSWYRNIWNWTLEWIAWDVREITSSIHSKKSKDNKVYIVNFKIKSGEVEDFFEIDFLSKTISHKNTNYKISWDKEIPLLSNVRIDWDNIIFEHNEQMFVISEENVKIRHLNYEEPES